MAPPTVALNVRADVLTVRLVTVKPVTLSVTLADCVPAAVVMEMVPVQVVPAAMADGSTETVKFAFNRLAVKLPVGERDNQLLVVQVCSDTWAVALVLVCAVTVRVCEAAAPPAAALKVSAEELNVRPDAVGEVTLRVTVAVCVPPAVIMEIVPVHVVLADSPD